MVRVVASLVVDRGFEPPSGICICCFHGKAHSIMKYEQILVGSDQDNVSEWRGHVYSGTVVSVS